MANGAPDLAELHRCFDGPIDERLRRAALSGRRPVGWDMLADAGRDLDRLALASVRGLARLRASTGERSPAAARLLLALRFYRSQGVRTIDRLRAARAAAAG